jgi:hypothetical protein
MNEAECMAWWGIHFPDSPPVGFMLRQKYPERWLRIHSLPESKRYAETEGEYEELLLRHNAVATETLGEGSRCYLIQGFWVEPDDEEDGWTVAIEGRDQSVRFEIAETVWRTGEHDALIREVADWEMANVVFASRESGCVYAPYDGGTDLILQDSGQRDRMRQTYRAWLSMHPEGL